MILNVCYLCVVLVCVFMLIYNVFGFEGGIVDVFGFDMVLDLCECVDNGFWF